ncbi:MAG TPA: phage major capsid protein [Alphaproteobacteria bacterium]|nr:phage major capsid protein [Alphaproteobacteria bacterium]
MTKHVSSRAKRGVVAVRADASGDTKKFMEQLAKNFEDFKAANDERLQALEKGKGDVLNEEKVDRINEAVTETQTELKVAIQAATARMDEIETIANRPPAGGTDKDDERDVKAEAEKFLSGKGNIPVARVAESDVEAYAEYVKAFPQFLKFGDRDHGVHAAMQVGSDPDGGYWVPAEMSSRIISRLFETSPVRSVASVINITTDSIKFPNDVNDATSGGWVGETDAPSDTATQKVGEQEIYVREQYAQPKVTQKLLDMATIDVEGWLNGKIADKLARVENTAFVSGSGVSKPRGFLDYKSAAVTTADSSRDWGVLQYKFTGASGGFPAASGISGASDPDSLVDVIAALKPVYRANARWVMNRLTEAEIRKLKDADGRYLVGMGDLRDGTTGFMLLGYPITDFEDMPDIGANSFSVAFGDFRSGYQVVDGRGIRVLRDPYTDKPYVKFYTTKWTGGDVVDFDALKLLKFGTS